MRTVGGSLAIAVLALTVTGCDEGDTTTIIQTAPPTPTATAPPEPASASPTDIAHPTADDYHQPLRVWPTISSETQVQLALLFLNNNPTDCAEVSSGDEAAIGIESIVDQAANDPSRGAEQISDVMLAYCGTGG